MWDNIVKKIRPRRPRPESADIHRPHGVDSQEEGGRVDVHSDEAAQREAAAAFAALKPVAEQSGGREAPRKAGPRRQLDCPACGAAMALERIGRVEVDRCPKCRGIFLDRGELEQLSGKKHSSYVVSDPGSEDGDPDFLIYTPHGLSDHVRDS